MKGLSPIVRLWSVIEFATTGGLLGGGDTVTAKVVWMVPPFPSSAVTVMLALPAATGVTVSTLPAMLTVVTAGLALLAV